MTDERRPTTERLARALEALDDPGLAGMIRCAREGYYDDFKSPLTFPLVQLYNDLTNAGHPEVAQRVVNGEFDATREEGEAWIEKEVWALLAGDLGLSDRARPRCPNPKNGEGEGNG